MENKTQIDRINDSTKLLLSKYGWSMKENIIYNKNNKPVIKFLVNGGKYIFLDMAGNKLMQGKFQFNITLERLLTEYYYCKPI